MGATVFDTKEPVRYGAHVYAHSRKDGKEGLVYLVINNNLEEATQVELPKEAEVYMLAGEGGNMRASVMTLNGTPLVLGENNEIPAMNPVKAEGMLEVAPGSCAFIALYN